MASGNLHAHPDGFDPDAVERPVYAATIRPHQSLSRDGFRIVMGSCGLVSLILSIASWRMGFWPVAGFFGLDMLALYVALSVSIRRGASFEEVAITPLEVSLARVSHRGARQEWHFNPLWTKIERVEDEEFGLRKLTLISRRQKVDVARDAAPCVRASIAEEIGRALAKVKKGF